jgi:hypothetical protein
VKSSWSSSHCLARFYSGRLILNFHVTLDFENYFSLPLAPNPNTTSWGITFDSQSGDFSSWQGTWHVGHIRLLISCVCWFLITLVGPLHGWFLLIFYLSETWVWLHILFDILELWKRECNFHFWFSAYCILVTALIFNPWTTKSLINSFSEDGRVVVKVVAVGIVV